MFTQPPAIDDNERLRKYYLPRERGGVVCTLYLPLPHFINYQHFQRFDKYSPIEVRLIFPTLLIIFGQETELTNSRIRVVRAMPEP